MATATKTKPTITSQTVDFSNVKEGGATFNKKRVPAGDYAAKVTKVQDSPAKDGIHQWLFTIELTSKFTDRKFPYYCKLQENQLWKLRNLFLAGGVVVPKKKVKVDPTKIVGRLIGITLEDDEYDNKLQSVISAVFPASDLDDAADEADDLDEDEEEGDDEEEDEDATDEEDDEEDEEEEEPAPAPPVKKAAAKKTAAKKAAPTVSDDELEELDLDDL